MDECCINCGQEIKFPNMKVLCHICLRKELEIPDGDLSGQLVVTHQKVIRRIAGNAPHFIMGEHCLPHDGSVIENIGDYYAMAFGHVGAVGDVPHKGLGLWVTGDNSLACQVWYEEVLHPKTSLYGTVTYHHKRGIRADIRGLEHSTCGEDVEIARNGIKLLHRMEAQMKGLGRKTEWDAASLQQAIKTACDVIPRTRRSYPSVAEKIKENTGTQLSGESLRKLVKRKGLESYWREVAKSKRT